MLQIAIGSYCRCTEIYLKSKLDTNQIEWKHQTLSSSDPTAILCIFVRVALQGIFLPQTFWLDTLSDKEELHSTKVICRRLKKGSVTSQQRHSKTARGKNRWCKFWWGVLATSVRRKRTKFQIRRVLTFRLLAAEGRALRSKICKRNGLADVARKNTEFSVLQRFSSDKRPNVVLLLERHCWDTLTHSQTFLWT